MPYLAYIMHIPTRSQSVTYPSHISQSHIISYHFHITSHYITSIPHLEHVTWLWHHITFVSGHVYIRHIRLIPLPITTYHIYITPHQFHISSHSYHTILYPHYSRHAHIMVYHIYHVVSPDNKSHSYHTISRLYDSISHLHHATSYLYNISILGFNIMTQTTSESPNIFFLWRFRAVGKKGKKWGSCGVSGLLEEKEKHFWFWYFSSLVAVQGFHIL